MKVGIFGAGAIGCYVGARLVLAKHDVVFLARGRGAEELRTHGIELADLDGSPPKRIDAKDLRVETDAKALADMDVVLVCVKSAQTEDAAKALAAIARDGGKPTLVVSMQNGVRNAEVLRKHLENALAGIVGFNVVGEGKGVFRRATTGLLVIEASSDERVAQLERALREAGFETEVTADIVAQQWSKLVMNLNNAVGALTNAPSIVVIFDAKHRRILRAIIAEALAVMKRAGIQPAKLGAIPVGAFPFLLALPTPLLKLVSRAQVKVDPEARSSMWQDLDKRRHTEVDWLNGEVVRLAEKVGMQAPVNQRVVDLVHAAEEAGQGSPCLAADDLYAALTRATS